MPRSDHMHWLIGSATTVLKPEFMTQFIEDKYLDVASSLPFSGPIQLPTKMQALKLFWFIRDEMGRHNSCKLSNGQIQGIVAKVVKHYWTMASYETVEHCPALRQVKRIVEEYQKLLKSKSSPRVSQKLSDTEKSSSRPKNLSEHWSSRLEGVSWEG